MQTPYPNRTVVTLLIASLVSMSASQPQHSDRQSGILSPFIPSPVGPYYGYAYDIKTTMDRYLPFTASGTCKAGTEYNITEVDDLRKYPNELECIFNTGIVPNKIPEGVWYGRIISALNTRLFNLLVNSMWLGRVVTSFTCNGSHTFIGFNNYFSRPLAPCVFSLGRLASRHRLGSGEFDDDKESIVSDCTKEIGIDCPDFQKDYDFPSFFTSQALRNFYPANQMLNLARFIGRQKDGGGIYIGKSLTKDPYQREDQPSTATLAFWSTVNYDHDVMPDFNYGDVLPPLDKDFKYIHPGIKDFVLRSVPFDNFATSPFRSIPQFSKGVQDLVRTSAFYAQELMKELGNITRNTEQFRMYFNSDKLRKRSEVY